jgi:pyrimidine-nucleoside phosphorylase
MSKKIAGGAQAIVLDVKVGRGAFMETLEAAHQLSALMEKIGELAGRKVVCVLSDMNQPLGHAVGNALEVVEAVEALHGRGPADFREHCLRISAHMLVIGSRADDLAQGRRMAERALDDGTAFDKFRVLVDAQGGEVSFVDDTGKLPKARFITTVAAPRTAWLSQIDARTVGEAAVVLGAGRSRKTDPVDHAVGFVIHHKVGDHVQQGAPLFTVHANDQRKQAEARERVLGGHSFSDEPTPALPLFYE